MNRFWILGTGNWSDTAHWSASSGGAGGASVPTSSDDVLIDANSGFGGGGTITLDVLSECNNFTSTSEDTYAISGTGLFRIYGSLTLESGLTIDISNNIGLFATSSGKTITIGGATISCDFYVLGVGGGWILQDDLVTTGQFYQENGTFDANDHNVTANDFYFYAGTGYTPTIIMGSGIWEATGINDVWYVEEYSGQVLTVTPETSTIKITSQITDTQKIFTGGNKTYNNIWIITSSTISSGDYTAILGSNVFSDFKVTNPPQRISFGSDETTTVSSFTVSGTAGNLIILEQYDINQFTLSKSSEAVECEYLDISNSDAIGGASFVAHNSTDSGNNDGWSFNRGLVSLTRNLASTRTQAGARTLASTRTLSS